MTLTRKQATIVNRICYALAALNVALCVYAAWRF